MSLQLNIDYPETLPDAMGRTREQFEREAKWAREISNNSRQYCWRELGWVILEKT